MIKNTNHLKRHRPLKKMVTLLVIFLVWPCCFQAQPYTTRQQLDKHNLAWIKTNNDFNQKYLTVDEIDTKIKSIITNEAQKNVPLAYVQVPINSQKIVYLGYKYPAETGIFNNYSAWYNNGLGHLNVKAHFYTYDNFIFSTENDQAVDQKNVYYAIRSICILQYRYPRIYNKLFTSTQNYISNSPAFGNFLNSNKGFWIAFNKNPIGMASNNTVYLGAGYYYNSNPQIGIWNNIAVINIHSEKILGSSNISSKLIYNKENSWENYELYMTEGLPVSMIHEMTHNYIDYAHTADADMFRIRLYRGSPNFNLAEENAVVNTIYSYFNLQGGLLNNQSKYYYKTVFEPNIKVLEAGGQIKAYAYAFSNSNPIPVNYKDIFKLHLF